jgi:hypothetical protein
MKTFYRITWNLYGLADRTERNADLRQAKGGAAPAVEEQPYASRLDQCALPELLQVDPRTNSGAKENDFETV